MRAEEQRRQPAPRYAGGMTEPDPDTVHRTHFVDNRANWDDRATLHEASGYGIAELLASPTALTKDVTDDRERLGDLVDLDVIHLQCHLGARHDQPVPAGGATRCRSRPVPAVTGAGSGAGAAGWCPHRVGRVQRLRSP